MLPILLKALRLPFVSASVLNFLVFWFALSRETPFLFWAGTGGVFFVHLAANLWNDFFDQKADEGHTPPSPLSGGSRVLQNRELGKKAFLALCLIFSFLALSFGGGVLSQIPFSWGFLTLLAMGALLAYFYTAPPFKLVYRGLGEPVIFLEFGPLLFLGTVFLSGKTPDRSGWIAACYLGILTAQILFANEFPDKQADARAGKKTWVVLLPQIAARGIFLLFALILVFLLKLAGFTGFLGVFLIAGVSISQIILFSLKKDVPRSILGLMIHFASGAGWLLFFLQSPQPFRNP